MCIFDEHQVQPAAAAFPARGHADLLPSVLKQRSDFLISNEETNISQVSFLQSSSSSKTQNAPAVKSSVYRLI